MMRMTRMMIMRRRNRRRRRMKKIRRMKNYLKSLQPSLSSHLSFVRVQKQQVPCDTNYHQVFSMIEVVFNFTNSFFAIAKAGHNDCNGGDRLFELM